MGNTKVISKFNVDFLHYKTFHPQLKNTLEKYGRGKVLDIGCGNKPYEDWFSTNITDYIGCDIIQSDLHKVDVLCPANKIPLDSETFDTVISTQTIEHVEDHQGLVNEAFRLLRKDGYFILSGPMYWYLHEQPFDFFRFTRYGFKEVLVKAGFNIIDIQSNGGMWAVTGQTINHSFINSRSKNVVIRCCCTIFKKFRIYWLVNSFFAWLDKVDYNDVNTMNYVVVGKKPA
jgi:SAM-dependent methyltransferase